MKLQNTGVKREILDAAFTAEWLRITTREKMYVYVFHKEPSAELRVNRCSGALIIRGFCPPSCPSGTITTPRTLPSEAFSSHLQDVLDGFAAHFFPQTGEKLRRSSEARTGQ